MGLLLILIALIGIGLTIVFLPLTLLWNYTTYGWKKGNKKNSLYLGRLALSIDQTGNVYLKEVLNRWTAKGNKYFFGDEDDTISFVIAMNFYKGVSNWFGRSIGKMLNFIDKNHLQKSIVSKYKRDLESLKRLDDAGIIEYQLIHIAEHKAFVKYVENVTNKEI